MEAHVKLSIFSGTITHEELCSQLRFKADKKWSKGDLREGTSIKEKENGLMISSKEKLDEDLDAHINSLRDQIGLSLSSIKNIASIEGCDIQVSCAIYCKSEPSIFFDPESINWINNTGASLDIDLYLV